MTYDEICAEYDDDEITIFEHPIQNECEELGIGGVKGLYKNNRIAIDKYISKREKKCTLCEELGHHHTSIGNILDLRYANSRKQERRAREWGATKLINFEDFITACRMHSGNIYEIAEELDVTLDVVETYCNYLYRKCGL